MVESSGVAFYGRERQAASLFEPRRSGRRPSLVFCEGPTQVHSENFSAYHCYAHRLNHRAFVDDPGSRVAMRFPVLARRSGRRLLRMLDTSLWACFPSERHCVEDIMVQIVIVGGGFGGLAAAKALRHTSADIILIDRTNHHVFQPLLYQVATSVLSPSQIGSPIRGILRNQKNTTVILGEVIGVDKDQQRVLVSNSDRQNVPIAYDYLILATGVRQSYFSHNEFEQFAPGLKTLADAVAIRNKILQAFEQAEAEEDTSRHRDLLTFVLVGAGPTGVEMASAIAILVRSTLKSEFRRIDPASARIVLVDMAPRVLPPFSEDLSTAAKQRLEKLGVEVRLGHGLARHSTDQQQECSKETHSGSVGLFPPQI